MKWRDACEVSMNRRAKRSTESEHWIITDPDTVTITYSTAGYRLERIGETPQACTIIYELVSGEDGVVEHKEIRYAWMKEMDQHEDWEPIVRKEPNPMEKLEELNAEN